MLLGIATVNKYSKRAAIVQAGWKTHTVRGPTLFIMTDLQVLILILW